jgi:hypothetical protein
VSRLAGMRHVITLKREAASATEPDRSPLIQATIPSFGCWEASEERWNDATGSSLG